MAKKFSPALLVLLVTLLLTGCAGMRKAKAAKILSGCSFTLGEWTLDSAKIDSNLFPKISAANTSPFPNSQVMAIASDLLSGNTRGNLGSAWLVVDLVISDSSSDTLWVDTIRGSVRLDTLIRANWKTASTTKLAPGLNHIPVTLEIPLDARLFRIAQPDTLFLEGAMTARLEPSGDPILLEWQRHWPSPKEKFAELLKKAKKMVLDTILNGWAGSLL